MKIAMFGFILALLLTSNASAILFTDEAGNVTRVGEGDERVLLPGGLNAGGQPSTPIWEVVVDTSGSVTTLYICAGLAFGSQHGGVYVSDNDGVDFSELSSAFPNDFVLSLAMDKTNTQVLLSGTDGSGMYRTTDAGSNWFPVLASQKTRYINFDDLDGAIAYSGNEGTGVFKSTDNGVSWFSSNAGMSLVNAVAAAVDPSDSNHIYAIWQALNSGGVFSTTDGGMSWTPAPNLPSQRQTAIAVDPVDGNIVYVCNSGPWNLGMDDGVYKSTDGGDTWVNNWAFPDTAELHSVSVAPSDPNIIFAGGNKWLQPFGTRIWKSTDAGSTWALLYNNDATQFVAVGTIAINPLNPQVVYAGAQANGSTVIGVLKTADGGSTWAESNTGLADLGIMSLAIDPGDTARILVGTAKGVFISTDCGANWTATDSIGYTFSVAVRPDSIIYAGTLNAGVYRSTDFGVSWTPFNNGISVLNPISYLAIDPSHQYRLFAALSNIGVYAVADTGACTWTAIGPFGGDVNTIAIVPSDHQKIFAGTQSGIFKSTDGGAFWEKCAGSPAGEIYIVRSSFSGDTVYAGGNGYFRSLNGGTTFNEIILPTDPYKAVTALSIDPYDPLIMYLGLGAQLSGSYCHVLKSTDAGSTWEFKCGGLPFASSMEVSSIGINPTNTLKLYATFGSGFFGTSDFYVSLDGGEIWTHPVGIHEGQRTKYEVQELVLGQGQPNPLRSGARIDYQIPKMGRVSLGIYDISGRLVETLVDETREPGLYRVEWDARSQADGTYFARLQYGDLSRAIKLIVIR
jgi:photosystem II stability/assembly factor-like uncharacterized protein